MSEASPHPGPEDQLPSPVAEPKKDTVSYDTHRKLLDEKKKLQEKFELLAREKEERERREMEAKGEYQKIIELERQRAEAATSRLKEFEDHFQHAKKTSALLKALDNAVDEKFYGFLPVEKIVVEPDTGEINLNSVAEVAESFRKSYPELVRNPNGPRLPADAPQANMAGRIAASEWKKLSSKEMTKYKPEQIIWGK